VGSSVGSSSSVSLSDSEFVYEPSAAVASPFSVASGTTISNNAEKLQPAHPEQELKRITISAKDITRIKFFTDLFTAALLKSVLCNYIIPYLSVERNDNNNDSNNVYKQNFRLRIVHFDIYIKKSKKIFKKLFTNEM
jgi:hypothetical protein